MSERDRKYEDSLRRQSFERKAFEANRGSSTTRGQIKNKDEKLRYDQETSRLRNEMREKHSRENERYR